MEKSKPRLHQVLGTKSEPEQVERVQQLLEPTVMITVIGHPLHGIRLVLNTSNGSPVPASAAYLMLDRAREQVHQMEIAELTRLGQAGKNADPKPPEGPAPEPKGKRK